MLRPSTSSMVPVLVSSLVVIASWCAPRAGRCQEPAAAPAKPIEASDLLRSAPFDRITLIDGAVLIVEPVSPRPLPAYDPKQEKERRKQGSAKNKAAEPIEIGANKVKAVQKDGEDGEEAGVDPLDQIKIHLVEGLRNEVRDFKLKRSAIQKIEYFEDLLLAESDRLVTVHDYDRAFECCLRARSRNPAWVGLDDHVNRVLFSEGTKALLDGDGERGLRLLRELLGRDRAYPGLLDQLAGAYGKRVERAIKLGLYARGRRVLHELEEVAPDHVVAKTLRGLFIFRATARMKDAEAATGADRVDGLVEALRIWPTLEGAEERYVRAFAELPTLDVGVTDVAAPLGPWIRTRADARLLPLLYRPLLAADDEDALKGKNPIQLASSIEKSDLGRRLAIRIRPGILWSDGSRPVSANDVAHSLIERSDPHSPNFEARWADLLDRVEVRAESKVVEVTLNHVPLKANSWLLRPVAPAHAGIDGRIAASSQERLLVGDGPYRCILSTDDRTELRLRDDRPAVTASGAEDVVPHIRRVRELRMSSGQSAVTALRRGDVTMIDHVPPDQLTALGESPGIRIGRYTQPVVHLIAMDGRNPALRSRALRRGLSYAIDRKGLLEETVLKHPPTDLDAPSDGPFPRGIFADAAAVKPLESNLMLAKMLVAAARKELGGGPIKLKFEYPAIPEVRVVVQKLAEAFTIAGLEIVTSELPESRMENELRRGRRFDLAYRVVRCEDPIFDVGPMLCPGYDAPPEADTLNSATSPRILQLLLQLERAPDWVIARGLVIQIDRESRDELPVIPLWQLADHYAWRDRLKGPGETANHLYQGLESWDITPWIPREHVGPTEQGDLEMTSKTLHFTAGHWLSTIADSSSAIPRVALAGATGTVRSAAVRRRAAALCALLLLATSGGLLGQEPASTTKAAPTSKPQSVLAPSPSTPSDAGSESASAEDKPAEPMERQPYRIVLHFGCHPSSRIDDARRADWLHEWQVLVRRFVGAPWSIAIAPPSSPFLDLDLENPDLSAFASVGTYDKVWIVHADRADSGSGLVLSGREYDVATRRLGPFQRRNVETPGDAPRACSNSRSTCSARPP